MERRSGSTAAIVITVSVVLFVMVGVWWIESRFGSTTAILVIGGLFGVICLVVGYLLNMASTKHVLSEAANFNHDLAESERYRQATQREFVRGEREAFSARAKLDVIDMKRVDQIAQQRMSLLMDLERQKLQQPVAAHASTWMLDDDDEGGSFKSWE